MGEKDSEEERIEKKKTGEGEENSKRERGGRGERKLLSDKKITAIVKLRVNINSVLHDLHWKQHTFSWSDSF